VTTTTARLSSRPVELLRFDSVQRAAHWANALLFGTLMATALPLYFGALESIVGRRHLIAEIHLWAGVLLPVPIIVSLVGPWGARMRRDLKRINRWSPDEVRWLRQMGTEGLARDKFNPGQKLNAIFTGGAIVVMLATGSIMQWFRFFPVSWRTGATFVHDVVAFAVFAAVVGHIAFALSHRHALRSMITGRIPVAWAEEHAGDWLAEELGPGDGNDAAAGG
jgi:formate dehydrogenase subunit gamma